MLPIRNVAVFCVVVNLVLGLCLLGCDESSSDSQVSGGVTSQAGSVSETQPSDVHIMEEVMGWGDDTGMEDETKPGSQVFDVTVLPDGRIVCSVPLITPIPVITIAEEGEVHPGTILHLSAEKSFSCEGLEITKWEWNVSGPEPLEPFMPDSFSEKVELKLQLPGEYIISLIVYDELDTPACFPDVRVVHCVE